MSFLSSVWSFFSTIGVLVKKAFDAARDKGLTEKVIATALVWVRVAATKYADNAQKREWVVSILMSKGLSEAVSRLAVELAVAIFKAELEKLSAQP